MTRLLPDIRAMLRIAIPLALAELGWMAMSVVDNIMVGGLPDSAAAIGATSVGSALFYGVAIFGLGMMSGLDIHYELGQGHPLLGRRMPDLDLVTAHGPLRLFTLLHGARPVLLNLDEPGGFDITPWADRVQRVDAQYVGAWELPALGPVTAPTAVLIRPDGHVAWVGDLTQPGLADTLTPALTTWFGPPAAKPSTDTPS